MVFVYDTQFNHSTAPNNALKPDGFHALFNGRFVNKLCIKNSKPFSIPTTKNARISNVSKYSLKRSIVQIVACYQRNTELGRPLCNVK